MGLVSELRRRNVLRMAVLYVVAAWLIMQVAEVIIGLANLPEWIGPTILGLLAVGFPIALIFSWFYELTPEGISLEKDVAAAESITHVTGRRIDFVVISLLCAGLILFAYDKWWIGPPPEKSIAVLAFENMSADPEQEYFSDGISEELLNLLAQIPELTVISRSSSFSFKDKDVDIPTVAKQLNVTHVLEGSVRKVDDRVRITAQLIEASSDSHLWSESYDRKLEDIFAIQNEIANAIVAALRERLELKVEATPRAIAAANTEAYEAYLKARYNLNKGLNWQASHTAVEYLEQSITVDPKYAPAYAALANAYANILRFIPGSEAKEWIAKAKDAAQKALDLDSTLAEAHVAHGRVEEIAWNWDAAEVAYRKAIELNPNLSGAHSAYAIFLGRLGHLHEALTHIRKAHRLDPLSPMVNQRFGQIHLWRAEFEKAIDFFQFVLEMAPSTGTATTNLLFTYLDSGKYDTVISETKGSDNCVDIYLLTWSYAGTGQQKAASKTFEELNEKCGDLGPIYRASLVYFLYRDEDAALDLLNESYDRRDPDFNLETRLRYFDPLRDHPRFRELMRKSGLDEAARPFSMMRNRTDPN